MSRSARHTHWFDSLVVREDLRGGVGAPLQQHGNNDLHDQADLMTDYSGLAALPIMRSESVKATNEGVVRLPWSFAMISTRSFCQMPTHE